ncbi:relaxase/mobilization nuclease domain-containing protein [Campylobacter jejuni]|uniref:relaxase/mobilization nuclease domain-containing protein n=1 Tax=Campylobacter jejuni TaxID=197 RepID=UPI0031FEA6AE|nr:relaxase/mobilization nuclease domain-containing protein [Campylobacter jejuni]
MSQVKSIKYLYNFIDFFIIYLAVISPEQAHKNAVELAEHTKAWKGHEVLIATHIDKGHIHTHFIVNSVNYENGHKLQWM